MNTPFLPPAPDTPPLCACGEPLSMECETDLGACVSCQAEEALGVQRPAPGKVHPIFEGILATHFPTHLQRKGIA